MSTCIDPACGKLLPLYECQRLDPEHTLQFEAHLLECDHCYREFARSVDVIQLLAPHQRALRQHYVETGRDFARELSELAAPRAKRRLTRPLLRLMSSFAGSLAFGRDYRFILPTVVAVSAVLFLVLRSTPPALVPHGTPDGTITEAAPDARGGASPHNPDLDPPSLPTGNPVPGEQTETTRSDAASPPAPRSSAEQTNALVAALLPAEPIPYTELATRSVDKVSEEAYKSAMRFYLHQQFDSCANALRELIVQDPGDATLSKYLGSSLYMSGDYAGAAAALTRTQQLSADRADARIRFYLAAALIRLSRAAEARGILTELTGSPNRIIADRADSLLRALK